MRRVHLSIVGLGTVGRWLADAVVRRGAWLRDSRGVEVRVVSVATRRGGFVHDPAGLDVAAIVARATAGRRLTAGPGARWWPNAIDGLAATLPGEDRQRAPARVGEALDIVAETSNTDPRDPEPSLTHLRLALERGAHVVTSSKGACAAAAVELRALARARGLHCRMESTVMSATPVLSTLTDGLAGATVTAVRGVLNGTANYVLTRMADGLPYAAALGEAQRLGYAEPDPADDVEGHDAVAKTRILAAVAFGESLALDGVARLGIAGISHEEVRRARQEGRRVRHVATISRTGGGVRAAVEPVALPESDPLARVDGVMNALHVETDTVSSVTIVGPGAGREQAGQGVFADLVAVIERSLDAR